jgi:glycine cleavage system H protein
MNTPMHLKYSESHEWVKLETDGTATIGITFHAQEQLGDIVFVQNPDVGRILKQGDECGVIESVKAAADLYSPLSGECRGEFGSRYRPTKVNEDPYALVVQLKPAIRELADLLDAGRMRRWPRLTRNSAPVTHCPEPPSDCFDMPLSRTRGDIREMLAAIGGFGRALFDEIQSR